MDKQTLEAHRIAGAAKRKGALSADLCREHGDELWVHISMFDGSARSEIIRRCGCIDTEIHRPAGASAAVQSKINPQLH